MYRIPKLTVSALWLVQETHERTPMSRETSVSMSDGKRTLGPWTRSDPLFRDWEILDEVADDQSSDITVPWTHGFPAMEDLELAASNSPDEILASSSCTTIAQCASWYLFAEYVRSRSMQTSAVNAIRKLLASTPVDQIVRHSDVVPKAECPVSLPDEREYHWHVLAKFRLRDLLDMLWSDTHRFSLESALPLPRHGGLWSQVLAEPPPDAAEPPPDAAEPPPDDVPFDGDIDLYEEAFQASDADATRTTVAWKMLSSFCESVLRRHASGCTSFSPWCVWAMDIARDRLKADPDLEACTRLLEVLAGDGSEGSSNTDIVSEIPGESHEALEFRYTRYLCVWNTSNSLKWWDTVRSLAYLPVELWHETVIETLTKLAGTDRIGRAFMWALECANVPLLSAMAEVLGGLDGVCECMPPKILFFRNVVDDDACVNTFRFLRARFGSFEKMFRWDWNHIFRDRTSLAWAMHRAGCFPRMQFTPWGDVVHWQLDPELVCRVVRHDSYWTACIPHRRDVNPLARFVAIATTITTAEASRTPSKPALSQRHLTNSTYGSTDYVLTDGAPFWIRIADVHKLIGVAGSDARDAKSLLGCIVRYSDRPVYWICACMLANTPICCLSRDDHDRVRRSVAGFLRTIISHPVLAEVFSLANGGADVVKAHRWLTHQANENEDIRLLAERYPGANLGDPGATRADAHDNDASSAKRSCSKHRHDDQSRSGPH